MTKQVLKQIVRKLREDDKWCLEGMPIADVIRCLVMRSTRSIVIALQGRRSAETELQVALRHW